MIRWKTSSIVYQKTGSVAGSVVATTQLGVSESAVGDEGRVMFFEVD
jgi:hypothetical protein